MAINPGIDPATLDALARRLADPNAALTADDQTKLGALFTAAGLSPATGDGFPGGPAGDVIGSNELRRTNWFNGRFLTAEAFRRQDAYFDVRGRLLAEALMPGVAYGLHLSGDALNGAAVPDRGTDAAGGKVPPQRTGGTPAGIKLELGIGLAFDMIGRPIYVGAPFRFTFEQLMETWRTRPRRVVGGGTEFAPCVCLADDPGGATGGGPAIRPGPYLLIIEAAESRDGDAKVYGQVCGGPAPSTCAADAWRGGFGLSLVRFPVDVPDDEAPSIWSLRGVLASYYFDVFEHSLISRWAPKFAEDATFCAGAAAGRRDNGAVALAMIFVGTDGTALFVDQWIPRRSIVDTPAEDWHRTTFGAPPRAAAWARVHAFQCMLSDSLAVDPLMFEKGSAPAGDLYRRGFRHIPPIGFLPIDAAHATVRPVRTGNDGLDAALVRYGAQAGIVSGYVAAASYQAKSYFRDSNVLAYTLVALHDDDVLEDLGHVFDKDPIALAPMPVMTDPNPQGTSTPGAADTTKMGTNTSPSQRFLASLAGIVNENPLADLVNRRIDIVKLIVPLRGLVRSHPVLGVLPDDQEAGGWSAPATVPGGNVVPTRFAAAALTMLPRHFVVYVKQRLVLLDVLFMLLEVLRVVIMVLIGRYTVRSANAVDYYTTNDIRTAIQTAPVEQREIAQAALMHPAVQQVVVRAAPLAFSDLGVKARATDFQAKVVAQDTALTATIPDATERRQAAVDQVSDSFAAEHPSFQVVQLLGAIQPAAQTESLVQSIAASAPPAAATVADVVNPAGPRVFTDPKSAALYAQMRGAGADRPVAELVPGAAAGVTVGQVLAKTPDEATALLGSPQAFSTFRDAVIKQNATAADAAQALSAPPPSKTAKVVESALSANAGDPAKAIEALRADKKTDPATLEFIGHADTMLQRLGPDTTIQLLRGGSLG